MSQSPQTDRKGTGGGWEDVKTDFDFPSIQFPAANSVGFL